MADVDHKARLYCTPPHIVKALLKREVFPGAIWEPAAGRGDIVQVLRECGYTDVVASDINDWGFGPCRIEDFLASAARSDSLITNPPFDLKRKFLVQAKRLVKHKIALLLPTDFEHTKGFFDHHEQDDQFPWKALYSFPQAIPWLNVSETWNKIKLGWFVFERGWNKPVIREKIIFRRNK